jgi:hypothetical protein
MTYLKNCNLSPRSENIKLKNTNTEKKTTLKVCVEELHVKHITNFIAPKQT